MTSINEYYDKQVCVSYDLFIYKLLTRIVRDGQIS